MRICVIVDNPMTYDRRVLRQVRSLRESGHDVTVVAPEDPEEKAVPDLAGATFVGVPAFFSSRLARRTAKRAERSGEANAARAAPSPARRLRRVAGRALARGSRFVGYQRYLRRSAHLGWRALRLRPEVIHANNLGSLPGALMCKVLVGSRVIYDAHELEWDRTGFSAFARLRARVVERACVRHADHVITSSNGFAAHLAGRYRIPPPTVVRNVAESPPEDIPREIHSWRENSPLVVLYVGVITIGRGLEQLVDALPALPDVHAVFMGQDMRFSGVLRQRAASLGVSAQLEIRDPLPPDELGSVLQTADIGYCATEPISRSYYYSLPNKAFLYLSYGLPVVASDLPEHRALFGGSGAGAIFRLDSANSLVDTIKAVAQGDRERYRSRALALAEENSWDREEARLLRVYDEVCPKQTP